MATYSALKQKKQQLIRKARDGSVFLAPYSAAQITTLTSATTPANEVQTVTITGTPTGGTFTLTFNGATTAAIAYNATAAAVDTALELLSTIGTNGVTVAGGPGPGTPYTVTFSGTTLAAQDVPQMTAAGSFTGGTSPTIAVTTTTPGVAPDLLTLPAGWEDLGYLSTDGASLARATDISDVNSFGAREPTRSDITRDVVTMAVTAQETKLLTINLQTGGSVSGVGLANATTGEVSIAKPAIPGFNYWHVLGLFVDSTDYGDIYLGRYMPRARVTEIGDTNYAEGDDPVQVPLTFTGYNDSTLGFSHKWYFGGAGWKALLTDMGVS